jgi:hypothetical protein
MLEGRKLTYYDIRGLAHKDLKGFNPAVAFGTASRFGEVAKKPLTEAPMRSSYSYSSLELNRLRYPFGLSHRAYESVQFPGCEREHLGTTSPGPIPLGVLGTEICS